MTRRVLAVLCLGLSVVSTLACSPRAAGQACAAENTGAATSEGPLDELAQQCGLACPTQGLADGNASISGLVSIDMFFGSALALRDASTRVQVRVRAEFQAIADSLGISVAGLPLGVAGEAVSSAMSAKFEASLDGELEMLNYYARCITDLELATARVAECEINSDPGALAVTCLGQCEVDLQDGEGCAGEEVLVCRGSNGACEGVCTGSCVLETASPCEGVCTGRCAAGCSSCAGGTCEPDGMGGVTNCAGKCDVLCEGDCELSAGWCPDGCVGECVWGPDAGGCPAGAVSTCRASTADGISCRGTCDGPIAALESSAGCRAAIEGLAAAEAVCTPTRVIPVYSYSASLAGDLAAQQEFRAWATGFEPRFARLLALLAQSDFIANATVQVANAANGSVLTELDGLLSEDLSLKDTIGVACSVDELSSVSNVMAQTASDLAATRSAILLVIGATDG